MRSERRGNTSTIQPHEGNSVNEEADERFVIDMPGLGYYLVCTCFDTALSRAEVLARIWMCKIYCRYIGERDEYPTYDMMKVSFIVTGDGEIIQDEEDGVYRDIEPGGIG